MRIAIAGGTGFVGKELTRFLINEGHELFILTRKNNLSAEKYITYVKWLDDNTRPEDQLREIDAIINLAGESINNGRWTSKQKNRILKSRLVSTKEIIRIIQQMPNKPEVLINASAIGFYGTSLDNSFTENFLHHGHDFLAETVNSWEFEAKNAEKFGVRTVFTRFGIVLGKKEGALPKMVFPYKLYGGGTIGSGKQWLSWIHIKDTVRAIVFLLENKHVKGPVNFTAPHPVTMKEFGFTISKILGRPHWMPVPGFFLRAALGEMSMLVLEGQKVHPDKLLSADFQFLYPSLTSALQDLL